MIELPWHSDRLLLTGNFPCFTANDLFDHWTKPELLAKFWPPSSAIDLRVGGYFRFDWPDSGWYLHGHYLRVIRGVRLGFDWTWNVELGRYLPLIVDMYFKDIEGGARMTIEQGGFAPDELQAMPTTAEGWIHFGDRLRDLRKTE